MAFAPEKLLPFFESRPKPARYVIALSGGLDSSVLLHAMHEIRAELCSPLLVVHVNHGLYKDSVHWAASCRKSAEQLSVPFTQVELGDFQRSGHSLEALAREARYDAISRLLEEKDMLITAHHGDDQVETFLLQWLRGAGVHGLAAMPDCRAWRTGWIARPLLPFSRTELLQFAQKSNLVWMEDQSNKDLRFDRNYLRSQVVPLLKERWPGLISTSMRSSHHCASAAALADEIAEQDLASCQDELGYRLSIQPLEKLSLPRQKNLLRHWIGKCGLGIPNSRKIKRILTEVLHAHSGAEPCVEWLQYEVRRYGRALYLLPALPPEKPGWIKAWDGTGELQLPDGLGQVRLVNISNQFQSDYLLQSRVTIGFRVPQISCTPAGRQGSRNFKKLAQDLKIPPWLRNRVPLLYVDHKLAAVGDYCVCEPFGKEDFELLWKREAYLA